MKNIDPPASFDQLTTADSSSSRRRFLLGCGAVGMAGLAGCTTFDVVRGEDVEFESGTATVADETLADSGYELVEVRTETNETALEIGGRTREVQITSRTAEYDKAVELFGERYQAAVFTATATPRAEMLGEPRNPISDRVNEELAELILQRYDDVSDLERGSDYRTSILDAEATVVVYGAQGKIQGTDFTIDMELHIADPVEVDDDFVVCLGAYPKAFGDGENVRRMMNGVQYTAPE